MDFITAAWPAPANVNTWVSLRSLGDMAGEGRRTIHGFVQGEPVWMRQVHGTSVVEADSRPDFPRGDAAVARTRGTVCAVMIADCMPVFMTDEAGTMVAVAHAGWRGLAAGVIEATVDAMKTDASGILSWLGPAIGPKVYEVGEEVRAAFAGHETALVATRPGRWLLDLYAVARQRLERRGVRRVYGGGFCTYSDPERFFSYRRDRTAARMAAAIWLT
jgi:YfiH family protein